MMSGRKGHDQHDWVGREYIEDDIVPPPDQGDVVVHKLLNGTASPWEQSGCHASLPVHPGPGGSA